VRVPAEAARGKARVHLTFTDWKGMDVRPVTVEVPIEDSSADGDR
jgi:hypothetical protein